MPDLSRVVENLRLAVEGGGAQRRQDASRDFVEEITFATTDEILAMLRSELTRDWMALPPWARNLAYRLACLQRPDDPALLREAAGDLLAFGPDWDEHAEELQRRADRLESPDAPSEHA
ncbi:hypothetical protein [Nocardiopsis sp. CNT312]|uniref:hypothetical protein n=1 Tax=Nocardiopsis sp. CNT312 TaxID=1137268 RepID=UPI00048EA59E|nr:hypothetical protein [Nocardiopsis sp. CNT312]